MGVSQQIDVPGRSLLQPVELILRLWDNREMVSGEMIRRGFTVNRANIISVQNASFIAAAAYLVGMTPPPPPVVLKQVCVHRLACVEQLVLMSLNTCLKRDTFNLPTH